MNERGRNEADISRYTDVEYSPEGYKTVYRWGDFLEIAGGHVYNAMDTIDLVSAGGEYEGFNPRYAYTCEFVGCSTLIDGIALFRPVSRDGEDLTQIAFLRSDIDDDTGAYTERFEAGSFDIAAASDIQCSDLGIDLLDYFRGRSFEDPPHRLPGNRRDLCGQPGRGPPSACIARRDQPGRPLRIARKRAPFLPWRRAETCAGVLQAGEGQRRQEPCGDSCRGKGRRGE